MHASAVVAILGAVVLSASPSAADTLACTMADYRAQPGLSAAASNDALTVTWDGDTGQQVRMRFTVNGGVPTIAELAVRPQRGDWKVVGSGLVPDFRVVSGIRRVTEQQLQPLRNLKTELTKELIDTIKWDAFWDAPLNTESLENTRLNAIPPPKGILDQPGLPRKPDEITRASAVFATKSCDVKTSGTRLEVSFDGVQLGVFAGRLQYSIYKGTNLIEQEVIASTRVDSVAYKYEAGLKGLPTSGARVAWRDVSNVWQDNRFGGTRNADIVPLRAQNRLIVAENANGSIAAFPPPHNFFWSREVSYNQGYVYFRKDSDASFGFGVRQPEAESHPEDMGRGEEDTRQNFALRSARPGTQQRMPIYLYVSATPAEGAASGALAFTRGDKFKPLPGYQVMATHFHSALVGRIRRQGGSLDTRLHDFDVMKAAGVNIYGPIDGSGLGFGLPREDRLKTLADYYEVARRHSDKTFLIMPNEEGAAGGIGGHNDLLLSKPVYWIAGRQANEAFVEDHPTYGKVYRIGGPEEMMEMVKRENLLIYMPHPRSKGSTGYPDAIKDRGYFLDDNYRGIGVRWGMGVDGSEQRLCEIRCQTLWDEMNNWVADKPGQLKFIQAITETYEQGPGDDFYANSPVQYVRLETLPLASSGSWDPVIDAIKRGEYFWTSGEVLISNYAVQGAGAKRTIVADLEWTFPLEFMEVVWGDGVRIDRQIISATDLGAMGRKRIEIPFDATGKKWVRFAAWDTAGNGAMVQPVRVSTAATSTR